MDFVGVGGSESTAHAHPRGTSLTSRRTFSNDGDDVGLDIEGMQCRKGNRRRKCDT